MEAPVDATAAAFMVAVPVAVYLLALRLLHGLTDRRPLETWPILLAIVMLVTAAGLARVISVAGSVLLIRVVAALVVANYVYRLGRLRR